jgi:hypothetical protein
MRLRSLVVATGASLALCVVGVPAASAADATAARSRVVNIPALYKLPVQGVAENGKRFKGTYRIQRFVVRHGRVVSIGTLKGRLSGHRITRYGVRTRARLRGPDALTSQATCPVLHLILGPINLNLLGLHVRLGGGLQANQPIVLDITAVRGGGLLGDLLCGLTNALSGPGILNQLRGELQQLAATLNSLISLLGGLQATG